MGQMDLAGKTLLDVNEVFADIANVIIYKGSRVIRARDLVSAQTHSQFHVDGEYHEQIRDVSKYWNKCDIRIAFIGIENENRASIEMPLRILSYDGGAYKEQINYKEEKADEKIKVEYYPVVSLVLNFNTKRRWSAPKTLKKVISVPPELDPFVNDYKVNVVDVAFLDREVIDSFKSDFYIVADYFWQIRNNKDYDPSKKKMKKAKEVLQMMSAITGDKRFEKAYNEVENEGAKQGGGHTMCEYLDKLETRGEARGEARGEEKGIKAMVESYTDDGAEKSFIVKKLVKGFGLTEAESLERVEKYGMKTA